MSLPPNQLPGGLLLAYYGDDFTGSTDAMEAMAAAGLPTVLFLQAPTPSMLARFPDVRCVGLAGSSRGRSPEWMDRELAPAFDALAALGAPILQYKICSTFDSSPQVGSIGRAIELGTARMPGRWSPMVVGAPRLKRFQAFGNLFASVEGLGYRLDRHPTMSRHPVTPMDEADLRRHLGRQTDRRIELIDLTQVRAADALDRVTSLAGDDRPVVMIDVVDDETLAAAGRLVWEGRGPGVFSASSSGLEYALVAHWRREGLLPQASPLPVPAGVPAIAVVSGSCSPVTAGQIAAARDAGFAAERLDLDRALPPRSREAEIERRVGAALAALDAGRSPLVFSAEGPDDPTVSGFAAIAARAGLSRAEASRAVGETLAEVMRRLVERSSLTRIVVAGGDSSGEVMGALAVQALDVAGACAPGAPLCRAHSDDKRYDGLEVVLKGGQIGGPDFFATARDGG